MCSYTFQVHLCFLKTWCIVFPCAEEELPVRLWEQKRGESCLGNLDVKIKGKWEPVCQQEVNASVAIATANVVCRELGCGHVLVWNRFLENNRHFSDKIGGFSCSGKEEKTRDCPMNGIESCKNGATLYIVCSGETD